MNNTSFWNKISLTYPAFFNQIKVYFSPGQLAILNTLNNITPM